MPFGFAGGLYDAETRLVRFGARDYEPTTGRWTAKDPIAFGGGQENLLAYVDNEPVNRKDPTGLHPAVAAGATGALVCGPVCGAAALIGSAALIGWGLSECANSFRNHGDKESDDTDDRPAKCEKAWESQNAFCRTLESSQARQACWADANKVYADCLAQF
jgi:RHS repeat-associated protein